MEDLVFACKSLISGAAGRIRTHDPFYPWWWKAVGLWVKADAVGNSPELSTVAAGARQRIIHKSTSLDPWPRCRFGGGVQPVDPGGSSIRRQARNQAFGARPSPLVLSPNSCRKTSLRT